MAAIIEVTGNRRLQLSNEEIARTFRFGQRWTKLKIGITWGFNGIQTFSGRAMMGLCSGSANGFTASLTDGYYGISPVSFATDPTWTFYAPQPSFTQATSAKRAITRIGSTITDTSVASSTWGVAQAPFTLSMWILTFIRTSWNVITVQSSNPGGAAAAFQVLEDFIFYKNMENELGTNYVQGLSNDDTAGTVTWSGPSLDSFSFNWNHTAPTVEIGHIGVIRFM